MSPCRFLLFLPEYRVDTGMGGIGVRAFDLALALSNTGKVSVLGSRKSNLGQVPFTAYAAGEQTDEELLRSNDVIFFFDLGSPGVLLRAIELNKFIVVENALPIEHLEYNTELDADERLKVFRDYLEGFCLQVIAADHFLARSAIERATLLSCLTLLGRVTPTDIARSRTIDHLISLVPIGYSRAEDRPFCKPNATRNLLLWTGGLWDFMAPEAALAVAEHSTLLPQVPEIGFLYMPPIDQRLRAHHHFSRLSGNSANVWIAKPTPNHCDRGRYINEAKALLSLGRPGIENETCVRLRIRDSLLYRRPVIVDPYGATADYVRRTGIGIVARSLEVDDLIDAIRRLLFDDWVWRRCVHAIEAERSRTVIDSTLEPFLEFGRANEWRPTRSSREKLAALDAMQFASTSLANELRLPFRT